MKKISTKQWKWRKLPISLSLLSESRRQDICREAWSANHHGDAATLDLISDQDDLVKAMVSTGKPSHCLSGERTPVINKLCGSKHPGYY